MSISGIGNGILNLAQLSQISSTGSKPQASGGDSDGDSDGSGSGRVRRGGGGGIASAISQALSQIGLTGAQASSSATASGASTQDPQQAIRAFVHDLFSAIRSQGNSQQTASAAGSGVSGIAGAANSGYGAGGLESNLQGLIQQLSASSSSSPDSGSSANTSSNNNSALAGLQQDFQNLANSLGASGSQATLSSFLQAFSQNLHNANPAGNIVNTQA
ncbi:MAG: hypothetical protein K8F27_00180 [Sulfuricellaceae bacterium]|nr:hypothetical protein [Sulfuricellaceae bacterium]